MSDQVPVDIQVGNAIKEFRQHTGESLQVFATRHGVAFSTVSRYETCDRRPDVDFLMKIADDAAAKDRQDIAATLRHAIQVRQGRAAYLSAFTVLPLVEEIHTIVESMPAGDTTVRKLRELSWDAVQLLRAGNPYASQD